ncbi:MAG: hypothetical protein M3P39_08045, partial [Actinomycetota bacterium]|nr:hypothetical protein [Actinomycetota bacterium]
PHAPAPAPAPAAGERRTANGATALSALIARDGGDEHELIARTGERHVHAVPTNAELRLARAVELFNASPHPRTVSGVGRSLGPPLVTVRPSPTEGSIVGIVVAWELWWYRYEVDLADEAAGVRVVEQGAELGELAPEDQAPNAGADERGMLALVLAS